VTLNREERRFGFTSPVSSPSFPTFIATISNTCHDGPERRW
jgi:hypothetical protein